MKDLISGIQQIGIGVKDASYSLKLYAKLFGMNVLIFDDNSETHLMSHYTGSKIYNRRAHLSLNMRGGGGFEIWLFKDRLTVEPTVLPEYGDRGLYLNLRKRNLEKPLPDWMIKLLSLSRVK